MMRDFKVVLTSSAELDRRIIREWTPPAERIRVAMAQLIRLDTLLDPGLTIQEFLKLFAICRQCRRVMTRRVVLIHECIPADVAEERELEMEEERELAIIDLTEDD
jgi:hypothetical protein